MSTEKIIPFNVIGISVITTNENGQAMQDIPALWQKWIQGGWAAKVPGKIDDSLYCVYTDYEGDYTKPYMTLLGCKVESLGLIPAGMIGRSIAGKVYKKYTASGNIFKGIVADQWKKIWGTQLARTYEADFEFYGDKAKNPEAAEVDIFIGVSE